MVTATSSLYQVARTLHWSSTMDCHHRCLVGPASYWNWTWQQQMWETCRDHCCSNMLHINMWSWREEKTGGKEDKCLQVTLPCSYRMTEWLLDGDMKSNLKLSEIPFRNAVKIKSRGDPQRWRHTYTFSVAGCQSGYLHWRLTFHCCSFALPQFGRYPLYENSSSSWLTCSENNKTLCHFYPWELKKHAAVHTAFLYWLAPSMGQSN